MLRSVAISLVLAVAGRSAWAQTLDSVHVFVKLPAAAYTSSGANALAWRFHRSRAEHVTMKGEDIAEIHQALAVYRQVPHRSGPIPDLRYIAMAYTQGRPTAMGMTGDLNRLINFTAREEYTITSLTDHLKVRAALLDLMLDR